MPTLWGGILGMLVSMLMWLAVPWLDRFASKGASGLHKFFVGLWFIFWLVLTYLGLQPVAPELTKVILSCSILYVVFFILSVTI